MFDANYKFTCVDRFLKYVKYDTQSDEESTSFPSSEKQKILSKDLAEELKALRIKRCTYGRVGICNGYSSIKHK
jgi:tripeptide aminopeptidase